jgi:hypothetical protein
MKKSTFHKRIKEALRNEQKASFIRNQRTEAMEEKKCIKMRSHHIRTEICPLITEHFDGFDKCEAFGRVPRLSEDCWRDYGR